MLFIFFCPRFNRSVLTLPTKELSHLCGVTPAKRIYVDDDSIEEHELDAKEPAVKSDREANCNLNCDMYSLGLSKYGVKIYLFQLNASPKRFLCCCSTRDALI